MSRKNQSNEEIMAITEEVKRLCLSKKFKEAYKKNDELPDFLAAERAKFYLLIVEFEMNHLRSQGEII